MADNAAPTSTAGSTAPANDSSQTANQQPNNQQQPNQSAQKVESSKQPSSVRKFKVDGQDVEINLSDEKQVEQLLRDAGLGKTAFNRMREAAEEKKKSQSFKESLKKNPLAALEDPELNLTDEQRREVIEKYYQKKWLEAEQLSPEQRRIRELELKLQEKETKEQEEVRQKESEATERQKSEFQQSYQQQIITAIEKGGLPKTARTAARVAFFMAQAMEAGFEAPMETIIQQVGKDYEQELQAICADTVPIETILQVLPKSLVKRIRQYDLDQYKARQAQRNPAPTTEQRGVEPRKPKRDERPTYAEVLRKFGS